MTAPSPNAARSAALEAAEEQCRRSMTLMGPAPDSTLKDKYPTLVARPDEVGIRFCRRCTPTAQTWTCVFCDLEFDEHWKLKAHYVYEPNYCKQRGSRKAATWAAKS